ncbi:MAG: ral stress protein [Bacteroidota bacterium]|nr:ral stress protein [Bacteroidota bacterium]
MSDIKDLSLDEAVKKMKELVEKMGICMFCTKLSPAPFASRPMGTQKVDEEGTLWFFSNRDSDKNADIHANGQVQLIYSNESNSEFLCLYGHAEIIVDVAKAKELWTPMVKAWFKGPEDPDLTLIKVRPEKGHYWDTKHGKMVTMTKILLAAVSGSNMDEEGVEGMLMM